MLLSRARKLRGDVFSLPNQNLLGDTESFKRALDRQENCWKKCLFVIWCQFFYPSEIPLRSDHCPKPITACWSLTALERKHSSKSWWILLFLRGGTANAHVKHSLRVLCESKLRALRVTPFFRQWSPQIWSNHVAWVCYPLDVFGCNHQMPVQTERCRWSHVNLKFASEKQRANNNVLISQVLEGRVLCRPEGCHSSDWKSPLYRTYGTDILENVVGMAVHQGWPAICSCLAGILHLRLPQLTFLWRDIQWETSNQRTDARWEPQMSEGASFAFFPTTMFDHFWFDRCLI